jgi:hypothetical protein
MSIYELLSFDIPILAYSVLHQPRKSVTAKEYAKTVLGFRTGLAEESSKIQSIWQNYLAELTAKTEQTTRGNLSQFLSTPIQSDTGDIQNIISDQIAQTADQLLPRIHYGLKDGYDGRFLIETPQEEIPKTRAIGGRSFFQNIGFKIGRNNSSVFESLYFIQGGSNLDILEHLVRSHIGIYNSSHGTKVIQSDTFACSLYNLLFIDGLLERTGDHFELQVRFVKGKESFELYHHDLINTLKIFHSEVNALNISLWQKKLGLGIGEEYIFRVKTKDRANLRTAISILQKIIKGKGFIAGSLGTGIWLTKELL